MVFSDFKLHKKKQQNNQEQPQKNPKKLKHGQKSLKKQCNARD